ncbi:bifunctional nuclease family protein [Carboxylicivirga sp. RSCT41]|uniref:bifunctional nuclease family protein n=1 Tax=Carboxylicivirga agarovorans TaxID=3417570 RepID=UPI003D3248EC
MNEYIRNEKLIELKVLGLNKKRWSRNSYHLVLVDKLNEKVRMPVIIGHLEAQNIAIELEGLTPPLPLSHDLMKYIITKLDSSLDFVKITNVSEGIFKTMICLKNNHEELIEIEARLSDSIALALRFDAKILVNEDILNEYSIEIK